MSTRPLRTNFVVNLLSPSARIAIALVTIPIYIHHLGYSRYGVLTIAWILVGYFGFLDLGLSRASEVRLYTPRAAKIFNSALACLEAVEIVDNDVTHRGYPIIKTIKRIHG